MDLRKEFIEIDWIVACHSDTNHKYDKYLPYEFHLRMVRQVGDDFDHVMRKIGEVEYNDMVFGLWGHDLIEDTRVTYNDVKDILGFPAADIIYALTNEKGKTRKDRGNEKYYEGIKKIPGAIFVKLCDRIANVSYSKMSGSRMYEMYKDEHFDFIQKLGLTGINSGIYTSMVEKLSYLLNTPK